MCKSIPTLVEYLIQPAHTPLQRARAVYKWVTTNIAWVFFTYQHLDHLIMCTILYMLIICVLSFPKVWHWWIFWKKREKIMIPMTFWEIDPVSAQGTAVFLKAYVGKICLGFFVPLENFSLVWRRQHCRWRGSNFDICSAVMATEQRGFFSVPHLLCHRASVYNVHLRGPVTITPIAERLAVELLLPVITT